MTTPVEWERIEAALDEILALPEGEWPLASERLAAGDSALLAEIRSLLAHSGGRDPVLDRPLTVSKLRVPGITGLTSSGTALTSSGGASGTSADLQPGARVGPYELIRQIGAGGMAEVWLARRADGAFRREVALKLPMRSRLREDLDARFARERDILASLEHPQIARLYDAGVTDNGLPWLAMEFVQGQSLTAWCEAHALGIAERLRLVLQVLDAVSYAHARSVIHRDLKPSNILVTESGQVRLLDFGVAKLLQGDESDRTELTGVYGRALTVDYASPEMLRGEAVDARADLYSCGVLLYELLTGTRPYRLSSAAHLGMLSRAIDTVEVRKPSELFDQVDTQTHAEAPTTRRGSWARQLRGDLDAIVLKALAKQPAERYATASSLADDLQRYLAGKAVRAGSAGLQSRLARFVRRHRAMTAIAAAVLLAVAAAVILVTTGLHRSNTSTRPAQARAAPAVIPEKSIAVLPFVDLSEKHDQEYFSDGLAEELLDLLAQVPDLRVPARTSSFYFKGKQATIEDIAKALRVANVLEGSVRKSGNTLRVTAQLIRADTGYHLWSKTFDRDPKDIFQVQDEVASAVVEALKVQLVPAQAASHRTSNPEAYNEFLLAHQLHKRVDTESIEHAIEAYRRTIALDPNYAVAYAELAIAEGFVAAGGPDHAPGLHQAQLDAEKAVALAPDEPDGYAARGDLRASYFFDWAGAEADFAKGLSLAPSDSVLLRRQAYLLGSLGRLPEGIAALRKAIELDPLSSPAWGRLGRYLTAVGDYAGAEAALRRTLEIQPGSKYALYSLGALQLVEGRAAEALATYGKIPSDTMKLLAGQAMANHTLGNLKESQRATDELIAKYAAEAAYPIANVFAWRGDQDKAFEWLEHAYQQQDEGLSDIQFDPLMAGLRADPRYRAMLREMNLPQ